MIGARATFGPNFALLILVPICARNGKRKGKEKEKGNKKSVLLVLFSELSCWSRGKVEPRCRVEEVEAEVELIHSLPTRVAPLTLYLAFSSLCPLLVVLHLKKRKKKKKKVRFSLQLRPHFRPNSGARPNRTETSPLTPSERHGTLSWPLLNMRHVATCSFEFYLTFSSLETSQTSGKNFFLS